MPSLEWLEKLVDSMDALDKVVQQREDAVRLLQTGQEKPGPGAWRRDVFGGIVWHKFKQWPIPWYQNKGTTGVDSSPCLKWIALSD